MSPVDGAGTVNPNLPVDQAVTEGRVPDRAPRRRSRSCTKSTARRSCGSGSRS